MKTKTVLRIIFLSATVLLLVFVFIMSAKPAEKSAEISLSVDYRLCRLLRPGFDKLTEEEQLRCAAEIDHFVRKSAHFAEFTALGALFCADFLLFDLKRYQCVIFAFLLGATAAAAVEADFGPFSIKTFRIAPDGGAAEIDLLERGKGEKQ